MTVKTNGACWVLTALSLFIAGEILSAEEGGEHGVANLADRQLVLSSGNDSFATIFQFELQMRVMPEDGSPLAFRAIVERSDRSVAVLMLSAEGYPTALLTGNTFITVDAETIKVFDGGAFDAWFFHPDKGNRHAYVEFFDNAGRSSRVHLNVSHMVRPALVKGAEFGFESRFSRHWLTTPRGSHFFIYPECDSGSRGFPVRAIVAQGNTSRPKGRFELILSNFYVGITPPRTLVQMSRPTKGEKSLRFEATTYDAITTLPHLQNLQAPFKDNETTRQLGAALLRRFPTDSDLTVSSEELRRMNGILSTLPDATPSHVQESLSRLRVIGEKHVWRGMQKQERFNIRYDRFKTASRTEIAFGPEMARMLRNGLASVVTNSRQTAETRCDAIDLLGQFGLPPMSATLGSIQRELQSDSSQAVQVALSTLRVRQGVADNDDLARLHAAVLERDLPVGVSTQVVEVLAITDELRTDPDVLNIVLAKDGPSGAVSSRRVRALAANGSGQSALLDLLEQGDGRLQLLLGITSLCDVLSPGDPGWHRLVQLCREVALRRDYTITDRTAANRVVHRDRKALQSSYTEDFYQSALESADENMLFGAMCNMALVGRATECFDLIHKELSSANLEQRRKYGVLLAAFAGFAQLNHCNLSPAFWRSVDIVLADVDAEVRRSGTSTMLCLLGVDAALPVKYVGLLVQNALTTDDPDHLASICLALTGMRDADYALPVPRGIRDKEDVIRWIRDNADTVRDHLTNWHEHWRDKRA